MTKIREILEPFILNNKQHLYSHNAEFLIKRLEEAMIEFAKLKVQEVKSLQQSKYNAGETGYIKSEEWNEILNNIK